MRLIVSMANWRERCQLGDAGLLPFMESGQFVAPVAFRIRVTENVSTTTSFIDKRLSIPYDLKLAALGFRKRNRVNGSGHYRRHCGGAQIPMMPSA